MCRREGYIELWPCTTPVAGLLAFHALMCQREEIYRAVALHHTGSRPFSIPRLEVPERRNI
jgi:hypothetical protein